MKLLRFTNNIPINIFLFILIFLLQIGYKSQAQNQEKRGFKYGLKYSYCQNTIHYSVDIMYVIEKSSFSIGGNYTRLLNNVYGDPADRFINNQPGFNAAYGYSFLNTDNFNLSFNTGFFVYPYSFYESQLGQVNGKKYNKLIVENYVNVGFNYKLYRKLNIYSQLGFGSYKGFFLILDGFMPVISIGVHL